MNQFFDCFKGWYEDKYKYNYKYTTKNIDQGYSFITKSIKAKKTHYI